jgi:hypothetical protein
MSGKPSLYYLYDQIISTDYAVFIMIWPKKSMAG